MLEKIGASAYKLELPEQWKIHLTFTKSKLTPYDLPLAQHQKHPPPLPPEVVGSHKWYKVDEILNLHRRGRYGIKYLIGWKGYRPEDCTWAIPSNIKADNSIKEFHKKYPDQPKPYVKKAARIRFANIEERPHFDRVTFPAHFFNLYIPGEPQSWYRNCSQQAILSRQVMSTPLFLPDYNKGPSSPDTPWKPPPKSLRPEPNTIMKTEKDENKSAMLHPQYLPPSLFHSSTSAPYACPSCSHSLSLTHSKSWPKPESQYAHDATISTSPATRRHRPLASQPMKMWPRITLSMLPVHAVRARKPHHSISRASIGSANSLPGQMMRPNATHTTTLPHSTVRSLLRSCSCTVSSKRTVSNSVTSTAVHTAATARIP